MCVDMYYSEKGGTVIFSLTLHRQFLMRARLWFAAQAQQRYLSVRAVGHDLLSLRRADQG